MKRLTQIAICATLSLVPIDRTAAAGPLEDGTAAYASGNFAAAHEILLPLGNRANAPAQYLLGRMYLAGQGVAKDDAVAAMWFRLAAGQGVSEAQYNLAVIYTTGEGAPRQLPMAANWFLRAADQGDARAQCALGFMYALGYGLTEDAVQAYARLSLCATYATAGIASDGARTDSANVSLLRNIVADRMRPAEIAEAEAMAATWKPKL